MKVLVPSDGMHFKNINSQDIYDGNVYLGIYDSEENYVEVSEEEYQAYLEAKNESVLEDEEATPEDYQAALNEFGVVTDEEI